MAEEKVVTTTCASHCGGTCVLRVHVKDGVITRIETDSGPEPQLRACLRGRAYRQRVYAPDRLLYPLKRVGERGEGKFERVTWDEALDTVARENIRVRDTYGPDNIIIIALGGDLSFVHSGRCIQRALGLAGGYTVPWGLTSFGGGMSASRATYGTFSTGSNRDDLLNSRFIILWGWDPATTICGTNTAWYLVQAKERGARVVSIDPKFTDTAAACAHQWIPIRPGTDAAMLLAMAHVIISENLHDQGFLDTYAAGFDKYKDYVLGAEDGTPKTPQWAEGITGVPAQTIADLARDYARTKPAARIGGIAPGRTAFGEQYHRAAMVLAALTGNIGIQGGDPGGRNWTGLLSFPFMRMGRGMWGGPNQIEESLPPRPYTLSTRGFHVSGHIHFTKIADAILQGREGGYHTDIKLLYTVNTNFLNQHPNINKIAQALKKLEFFVVHEQFMTPTAKFADVILPSNTFLEREDVTTGEGIPHFGYMKKVIESQGESRSHLEICTGLASRLGVEGYNDRSDEEWLREIIEPSAVPDFDQFKEKVFYRAPLPEPHVAFKKEIDDPEQNPFRTPSGKIEIYSQKVADMNHPQIPPIPKYIDASESPWSRLDEKHPLLLISSHHKTRALSQNHNIPWLQELLPQAIYINTVDASARGIKDGEKVRAFNDLGEMIIMARVTERIMPGVVDVPQGAWYDPDANGVDMGGCVNTLTQDEPSPTGALASNTVVVQVERLP